MVVPSRVVAEFVLVDDAGCALVGDVCDPYRAYAEAVLLGLFQEIIP